MKYKNIKKKKINKSFNIIKKIKGCFKCHKIIKNKIKIIIKKNIRINYKKLKKFKQNLKYNINMKNIIKNLKNKYILEICKLFNKIPNIKKFFKIN